MALKLINGRSETIIQNILKKISAEAKREGVDFEVAREGANHTVCTLGEIVISITRHNEIGN
jgi:hypothetical protein